MSGHAFRGQGGKGLAANKVLKAILVYPKVTTTVWINQGFDFTVNPIDYGALVGESMTRKYEKIDKYFAAEIGAPTSKSTVIGAIAKKSFRNDQQFKSLSESDGTSHLLCVMFLLGLSGQKTQRDGIYAKLRDHTVRNKLGVSMGRSDFWHELQFVVDNKVVCVWKLEAEGVRYGAPHSANMQAAISEMTGIFNTICERGQYALSL